jgi:DNA modification methylase
MLYYKDDFVQIHHGNALDVLRELPDESVQCAMTSPPYWGLRNYAGGTDIVWGGGENCKHQWGDGITVRRGRPGEKSTLAGSQTASLSKSANDLGSLCQLCGAWCGQLGLEPTPELYVEHLMMIFREVKRILRRDGCFFLNIGDTYASTPAGNKRNYRWQHGHKPEKDLDAYRVRLDKTLIAPAKCMVCIPERVMFAMLGDGWILRNKIVWHKLNHMPGSQKDRFTQSWEYLYFFTKSRKYYFDLDSVRIPHKTQSLERYQRQVNFGDKTPDTKYMNTSVSPYPVGTQPIYRGGRNLCPEWFKEMFPEDYDYRGKFDELFGHGPNLQSFNLRVRDVKRGKKGTSSQGGELKASEQEVKDYEYPEKHHGSPMNNRERLHRGREQKHEGADLGAQKPARTKHSGYYGQNGEALVDFVKGKNPGDIWSITTKPSSVSVCPQCEAIFPRLLNVCPHCKVEGIVGHFAPYPETLCIIPIRACSRVGDTILDPFAGGGTTGVAAKRLGRRAILVDCVRPYCVMTKFRLRRIGYQLEFGLEESGV